MVRVDIMYKKERRQKEGLFRKEHVMQWEQMFQNTYVKQYGLPLVEGSLAGVIATVPMTQVGRDSAKTGFFSFLAGISTIFHA